MDTFVTDARAWRSLLRDVGDEFVAQHLDASMQLAVALHCEKMEDAERVAAAVSASDRRDFLALSFILRRLVETAVRAHMSFLLPTMDKTTQQTERQTLVQSLPEAFELPFRQLLETNWTQLTHTHESTSAQQLDWKVITVEDDKRVVLRLQTADGRTRRILVPIRQFHELRHSAASVLQEMNEVEAHPIMRLAYMEQNSHDAVTQAP